MKFVSLLPEQICYRVNTPRWAKQPTSGTGAAKAGASFNRKGIPALYLALDEVSAFPVCCFPPPALLALVVLADLLAASGQRQAAVHDPQGKLTE